jgi:hypothetical protein
MPGPACVEDVHHLTLGMPHVGVHTECKPVYQVGGKSFVFVRNPRPDAFEPDTGRRYDDVLVFWVPEEGDKLAMLQDDCSPFFSTPHFDGHLSVLLRARLSRMPGYAARRPDAERRGSPHTRPTEVDR